MRKNYGVLLILAFICPSFVHAEPSSERVYTVGVIQSLTGIAAEDGKTVTQSPQLAAEELIQRRGREFKLITEDDGTQSRNTISAFEALKTKGVRVVIGSSWDFTTNALLPLVGRSKVVLLNSSTLVESLHLAEAKGYAFVNSITAESEAQPFGRYLSASPAKTVVFVFANNSWGETQLVAYRKLAEQQKLRVLDEIRSSSIESSEWNAIVPRLQKLKPELVVLLLNKNDITVFLRRAREQQLNASFFASKNLFDALEEHPDEVSFEGACFGYPLERLETQREFVERYKKRFGQAPKIYADSSYDILFILDEALRISESSGVELKKALQEVRYRGLVGDYSFDSARSLSSGSSSLVCIKNGKAVAVR